MIYNEKQRFTMKAPADYSRGKIYKLVSDVDDKFYVGSTAKQRLCNRKAGHKIDAKTKPTPAHIHFNKIGWENVKIVLIEEYPCENKMQLERQERFWIEKLKPTLNKNIPTRTDKEYQADNADKERERKAKYRKDNIEKERERNAKYRKDNIEKERERQAKYRAENRDALNEYSREWRAKKKAEAQASSS
jgi:group I intron endonuclease